MACNIRNELLSYNASNYKPQSGIEGKNAEVSIEKLSKMGGRTHQPGLVLMKGNAKMEIQKENNSGIPKRRRGR
jgi:hypothetical protein